MVLIGCSNYLLFEFPNDRQAKMKTRLSSIHISFRASSRPFCVVCLEMPWLSDFRSRMAVNTCAHDCHIAIFVLNAFITNSNRVFNLIGCIARCNITVFSVTFISWLPLITLNFYFPFTELAASFLLFFSSLSLYFIDFRRDRESASRLAVLHYIKNTVMYAMKNSPIKCLSTKCDYFEIEESTVYSQPCASRLTDALQAACVRASARSCLYE